MTAIQAIHRQMRDLANAKQADVARRFFKTGPGEYGEGDQFLGIRVPAIRKVAAEHRDVPLPDVSALLASQWHEERLLALFIMVRQYARGDQPHRERLFRLYLRQTKHVNNWDLVDSSAEHIVGPHLLPKERVLLTRLAQSRSVWERRIAVLSTFHYIKRGEFADALRIARVLLEDEHDLIHKAVGWMLREIGDRDRGVEEAFLQQYVQGMPRTMLRYAIEKFPEGLRRSYLEA